MIKALLLVFKTIYRVFKILCFSIGFLFLLLIIWNAFENHQNLKKTRQTVINIFSDNIQIQEMVLKFLNQSTIDLDNEKNLQKAIQSHLIVANTEYPHFSPSGQYEEVSAYDIEIIDTKIKKKVFTASFLDPRRGNTSPLYWDKTEQYFFFKKFYEQDSYEEVYVGKIGTNILLKLGVTEFQPGSAFTYLF